jgi:hypothetical protein
VKLVQTIDDIGVLPCLNCGGFLERQIQPPNSSSVETIDNGAMARPVEFNREHQELRKKVSDDMVKEATKNIPE